MVEKSPQTIDTTEAATTEASTPKSEQSSTSLPNRKPALSKEIQILEPSTPEQEAAE